ncbi:MAG: molybdate ABC transporter substrate-binding protein [Solirubrobacterales bacterium]
MLGKLKWVVAACLIALVALAGAGCGEDESSSAASPQLVVSAASSLKKAFGDYAGQFDAADVKTSFAGTDELAAQIESGARPDVLAAANTKIPDQLYAQGLVEKPVVFAGNRLVIAVPSDGGQVKSIDDLDEQGVTIAAGSESVPVGTYTRKVLAGLPPSEAKAIEANFRSNEPDVKGVVGKVATGAVDAGFVYVTDVEASGGKLKAIELPKKLQPSVAYGAAVVKGAKYPEQAQEFIDGLLSGAGQQALAAAGFEPPPAK